MWHMSGEVRLFKRARNSEMKKLEDWEIRSFKAAI